MMMTLAMMMPSGWWRSIRVARTNEKGGRSRPVVPHVVGLSASKAPPCSSRTLCRGCRLRLELLLAERDHISVELGIEIERRPRHRVEFLAHAEHAAEADHSEHDGVVGL